MKTGLSRREKILLFSLGLVALIYLAIQFVIIPLATRYSDGIDERERLRSEKAIHEIEVANLPSLRDQHTAARERFELLTRGYPENVPNEIIDNRWLTPICNNNNMSIVSLRFAQREETPLRPPTDQPTTVRYQEDGTPIEEIPEVEPMPVFTKVTAFMNVTGSYQSLLRLIDEVDSTEFLRLTGTGYADSREGIFSDSSSISLTFEVTLVNATND